jgi:hypothetical protein
MITSRSTSLSARGVAVGVGAEEDDLVRPKALGDLAGEAADRRQRLIMGFQAALWIPCGHVRLFARRIASGGLLHTRTDSDSRLRNA